jgi:hypothetical protein
MKYRISKTDDLRDRLRHQLWNGLGSHLYRTRFRNRIKGRAWDLLSSRLCNMLWHQIGNALVVRLFSLTK